MESMVGLSVLPLFDLVQLDQQPEDGLDQIRVDIELIGVRPGPLHDFLLLAFVGGWEVLLDFDLRDRVSNVGPSGDQFDQFPVDIFDFGAQLVQTLFFGVRTHWIRAPSVRVVVSRRLPSRGAHCSRTAASDSPSPTATTLGPVPDSETPSAWGMASTAGSVAKSRAAE